MEDHALRTAVAALLGTTGASDLELAPLKGGANNQVFLARAGIRRTVVKVYLQAPGDLRDRLRSEYQFASFAWNQGIDVGPQPVAVDWPNRIAAYEEIVGRALTAGEVSEAHVEQAATFVRRLNDCRNTSEATALGDASEAFFTVGAHVEGIDARVRRVQGIERADAIDEDAIAFVRETLSPEWARVRRDTFRAAFHTGTTPVRCLSPSDFGFHNALLEPSGRLRFIDFEYAGWDDAAKLVCDFFCQEAVPVPTTHLTAFTEAVTVATGDDNLSGRVRALLPAYRIKWCCIMLNEFLRVGATRRQFTGREHDRVNRKTRQLAKARAALARSTSIQD